MRNRKINKKISFVLILTCILMSSLFLVLFASSGRAISSRDLKVGDIILKENTGKMGGLIPGMYDHSQIYIGNGRVIESNPGTGVAYGVVSGGDVYRVRTSDSVRAKAVAWSKTKIGKKYDYFLVAKQTNGNKYYCSELNWASYIVNGGPDIDQNPGWSWKYFRSAAPTELADDRDTYYIGSL